MVGGDRSDETIEREIRARLAWEPEIEGIAIAVRVVNGVAMLEGATRAYQRAAAERIAQETPGVRAVDNRLRLIDPRRPADKTIAELAAAALRAEPAIGTEPIRATVHDGIVELSGEVRSGAQRLAAETAVVDLPGVVDVRNRITVAASPVQDDQIVAAIHDAFVAEAHAAIARIMAEVDGSRVTLTGTTRMAHYRYLAEHVAWQVPGVSEVRNEIRLEP